MPHFYVSPQNIQNNIFTIENEQFHYLVNVRRFAVGDEINIFDGLGNSFLARIDVVTKKQITGTILSIKTFHNPKIKVSLYTAIPKGERFDWLIEKSSEIGIYKLIPTIYSRSVVNDISVSKLERYKKISLSASSQCSRADIMNIEQPTSFFSILDLLIKQKNTLNILPWECEEKNSIPKLLNNIEDIENINIFIGPEGGFDNNEIEFALKNNFKTITLGKNILRVETAAIVASTIVLSNIEF
ncbi:MAG: RsmE family RNA methyltransferase [Endomicrobiia bacterium]|nr:RsmE family RNA methyltransferase [Endomicrobiaceae bacterium]